MMGSESRATSAAVQAAERRRSVGLFGVSAAHAVNHMYGALLPLIYPILLVQFHFSYSVLGIVIALSNLSGGVLQAAFGFINRRVSARALLGWENIALGCCAAAMAATGNVAQFAAVRWAGAIAGSPQHPVGSAYCAEEFPQERRGFALAAHTAGGNVGTLIVPIVGALAIKQFGWRPTLLIFALPIALMGVLTFILLRPEAGTQGTAAAPADAGIRAEMRQMLSRRAVVLVLAASTIAAGGRGLGVIMTYIPSYLQNGLHLNSLTTGVLFNILLIGSVAGTLGAGRLSDRFGRKRTLIVAYCLAFTAVVLLIVTGASVVLLAPALLFVGLTAFAESPLLQTFFADAIGPGSHRIGFGIFFTIAYGIGALWAAVIGLVVDRFGFGAAFMVMGLSYLTAAAVLLPAADPSSQHG